MSARKESDRAAWARRVTRIRGGRLGIRSRQQDEPGQLEHLRALVDDLDAIVWEADPETATFTFVSEGATTMVGFTPREWLADPTFWTSHIHTDDRERTYEEFRRSAAVPGALHDLEYRFLARAGRIVWLRQVGHVVSDAPKHRLVRGLMHDITVRKMIEEQHRDAEARYRALVEQLPAIVYSEPIGDVPAPAAPIVYISPRVEEILGVGAQEWMEDPGIWLRTIHPDDRDRVRELDERVSQTMEPFIAEYRMLRPDGRTIWIHDEASVLYDEDGTPIRWQGVMVDITAQRRAVELERDLGIERATGQRLREIDELKNTLLQAVSHDLRTPLAAILGLAITLERDDIEVDREEVRELGARIATNARKLDRLVNDLLDLDRLSRGIVEPVFQPTNVGALVAGIVRESDLATAGRVDIQVEPVVLPVDRAKVERIVENLLGNAMKHAPTTARVWVRVRRDDAGATIEVEDDGPGVPAELREEVFEPFRRGPSAPQGAPGVGIGLSLVRRFAELQGGRAWVEERPGGGASFKVWLPDVTESVARDAGGGVRSSAAPQ
jgi:PAS domain S-box-containing protein